MLNKLLITGAAGGLGRVARARLGHLAENLRLSDIVAPEPAGPHEEVVTCDLGDHDAVDALVAGCDGILHLGGVSVEDTFAKISNANLTGVYNLYEAARKQGVRRIFLASSNHAVGYHRQDEHLDASASLMPDGFYGVSKCFAEAVASLYYNKFDIHTAIVRIGSCFPEPVDHRMLATWLSYDDFVALVECVFRAPRLGLPIVYGVSANDTAWWDNSAAAYLGWRPKDNSARFRDKIFASVPLPKDDAPEAVYQGGKFTTDPIFKD